MAVKVGDKAPDFELSTKTAEGPKKLKLSGNFGKKNTVLLFFPMAFTGVCTKEMCEVSQGMNAYTGPQRRSLGHQRRQSVRAGERGRRRKKSPCRCWPTTNTRSRTPTASRTTVFCRRRTSA